MTTHAFTFFEAWIPGVTQNNLHLVTSGFVILLLLIAVMILYPRIKLVTNNIVPCSKFTLQNIFEVTLELLTNLCVEIIGPKGPHYVPFVGTIFLFLLVSNIIGLIPGFLPPTETWSTGAALAIIVFLAYNVFGFQAHGMGYLKHFFVPVSLSGIKNVFVLAITFIPLVAFQILFGAIEFLSGLLRPITLSIRLFVNISADHKLLEVFSGLVPWIIPLPFLALGVFVAFMQAFIFTLLTIVYISLAVSADSGAVE